MSDSKTEITVKEYKADTIKSANGNGAGTVQLPTEAKNPEIVEIETDNKKLALDVNRQNAIEIVSSRSIGSKRRILFVLAGLVVLIASVIGVRYWLHARLFESTDDAFIEGHTAQISPKVSGYVQKVYINDNQQVKAGDLLVEIDPRDYEAKLAEAKATLNAAIARSNTAQATVALTRVTAGAGVEQASAGVEAARSNVVQAKSASSAAEGKVKQAQASVGTAEANAEHARAQVAAADAEAVRARADVRRYQELFDKDEVSRQQLDQAIATAATADAQLEAARKRVAATEGQVEEARAGKSAAEDQHKQSLSQVSVIQAEVGQATGKLSEANSAPHQVAVKQSEAEMAAAEVAQAEAAVRQAELDLSYTKIVAPQDGRITKKTVEPGQLLQPGQALFVLVPSEMWVVANFKETQLSHMRPGQEVEIYVDAYPGKALKGHVDSFQTGTGSRFSLLPAENATGNYVKVVQRLPVKIVFDEAADSEYLLAPGMSVEPEVKVK